MTINNKIRYYKQAIKIFFNKWLRTCARCEHTFIGKAEDGCPKCGFGTYATFYVYGVFWGIVYTIFRRRR